jgi:hypothetical protein
MSLSKWRAAEPSFVGLAFEEELSNTSSELFVILNEAKYVGTNEGAINSSNVHFTIEMDCYCSWNCTNIP